MPRVWIDNREVSVPAGATLLQAARAAGFDVPALCWREGYRPNTSCMACVVKLVDSGRIVPSCATVAEEGMRVESETAEVRQLRRAALDLLLSDHAGECRAPCQHACPLGTDIPRMIREIASGRLDEAMMTLRRDIALPAVFGRLRPEFSERACRRGAADEPAAIVMLQRYVAEKDLVSATPTVPLCEPGSGKRVAIIGAGPAGLSAAYFLLLRGHGCTLFDACDEPGGRLREISPEQLPRNILANDVRMIEKLGARFELNVTIGAEKALEDLRREFDAVLVAVGMADGTAGDRLGLASDHGRLRIDGSTHETALAGVFAAGDAVSPRGKPVFAMASGKSAAECIDQHLRGVPIAGCQKLFDVHAGRPSAGVLATMVTDAGSAPRVIVSNDADLTDEQARAEAERCLHCDCRKQGSCGLQKYAEMYGADARHYRGARRQVSRESSHPDIIYEPGKCIMCGLCVQITERAGEPLGLAQIGRGFDVRVAVPFDRPLAEALQRAARECVDACPTGALAWRTGEGCGGCGLRGECVRLECSDQADRV